MDRFSPLQPSDRFPKLRTFEKNPSRDTASSPVAHALNGARLACNPEDFGNPLGPTEQFDDVGVRSHGDIKHHVYTEVNVVCNP